MKIGLTEINSSEIEFWSSIKQNQDNSIESFYASKVLKYENNIKKSKTRYLTPPKNFTFIQRPKIQQRGATKTISPIRKKRIRTKPTKKRLAYP